MKKFLAFLLAMMVAMSMFTFAFAEEGDGETGDDTTTGENTESTPTLTDEKQFILPKVYFLKNAGTDSPEVTFSFSITKVSVSDSDYYTFSTMPEISGNFTVTFADDLAVGTGGYKIAPKFDLPQYVAPGIFTYKIVENTSNVAGVTLVRSDNDGNLVEATSDQGFLYLIVTVARDDDDLCRVVHIHYENDENEKINVPTDNKLGVMNMYSAGQLAVTKTVTGNMGDQTKEFEMTITLNAPAGKTVASTISYYVKDSKGDKVANKEGKIEGFGNEASKTITINLAHDQTLVVDNIPYGVTYSVEEADYTKNNGGYDAPVYTLNTTETASNGQTPVQDEKMDSASETVGITNNKGMQINTGLVLDTLPYVILLAVAVAGVVMMLLKKRASRED